MFINVDLIKKIQLKIYMNYYRINMNFFNKKLVYNVFKVYVEVVKIIKK